MEHTGWRGADVFPNHPSATWTALHFQFQNKTGRDLQQWIFEAEINMQNTDRDLYLFLWTLNKTECLWQPVLSPHNLIINWQHILIAESLSERTKQEEHKSDEVCAVQLERPSTIKRVLIKITRGTNQELKWIVFMVPRIKNSHGRLMSWKHLGKNREQLLS